METQMLLQITQQDLLLLRYVKEILMSNIKQILDHSNQKDTKVKNVIEVNSECVSLVTREYDNKGAVVHTKIVRECNINDLKDEFSRNKEYNKEIEDLFKSLGVSLAV